MKKLFLAICLLTGLNIFSQTDFSYKVEVLDVTTLASAKQITDPLRDKFKVFPIFNDSLDIFEINTQANVTKEEIRQILLSHGYTLVSFSKFSRAEIKPIETIENEK